MFDFEIGFVKQIYRIVRLGRQSCPRRKAERANTHATIPRGKYTAWEVLAVRVLCCFDKE